MHDIHDERNQIPSVLASTKECSRCLRILREVCFRKDSSFRDGRRDVCDECANTERLTIAENTQKLRESNYNSPAVQAQRADHQEEMYDDSARIGSRMHDSELVKRLSKYMPGIFVTNGRCIGHLAVFVLHGGASPFTYLFYMNEGWMPEYSTYEFDNRDIMIREKERGWRTVLLRLIKTGFITEEDAHREFGHPCGVGSTRYRRELWKHRNDRQE